MGREPQVSSGRHEVHEGKVNGGVSGRSRSAERNG